MPKLPAFNQKGVFIALFFAFAITTAGVFLHGQVIPESPDESIVSTADTSEQDTSVTETSSGSEAATTDTEDQAGRLPPELVQLKQKLKEGVPTEEKERSQAIMVEADALIEQTDALIAQAGPSPISAAGSPVAGTDSQRESALRDRIAELRDKASELKARRQSE